jgi:CO dehydrogenase/acetyl-CoA synthase gamma subunit (corrinoid Fe-S protein)
MSDLLAVVGDEINDEDLLTEIERRRPDRVIVLAEEERDEGRAASLVGAIEERTGADVVGLADSRSQLRGWRFDRVVGDGSPVSVELELS